MFSTRKRCLIGIPIRGYQNFYSLPPKNWIWGPKTAKFGPKLAFWAKYQHFWPIWSNAWPKNNADKLSRWFSVMLVPKLLLTPIKIMIFGPKTAKFGPKYAFFGTYRPAHLVPCCLVGGWAARAVSRKTPIYFIYYSKAGTLLYICYFNLGITILFKYSFSLGYSFQMGFNLSKLKTYLLLNPISRVESDSS